MHDSLIIGGALVLAVALWKLMKRFRAWLLTFEDDWSDIEGAEYSDVTTAYWWGGDYDVHGDEYEEDEDA